MKIAIIGAGISGLAFYLYLRKLGVIEEHEVRIYEARDVSLQGPEPASAVWGGVGQRSDNHQDLSSFPSFGGSLGLASNGVKVLRRLDEKLYAEILREENVITSWRLSNARGWTLGHVGTSHGQGREKTLMIMRGPFWRCLRKRVPDAAFVCGKVTEVEHQEDRTVFRLAVVTEVPADLVVGADGVWSAVRRAMYAGEKKYCDPNYEGLIGVGGFVPASYLKGTPDGEMK